MDTIFALASARGKAGVAVIRVSGPLAWEAARALAGDLPKPRTAGLRMLRGGDGEPLDQAVVLLFAAGHSFTGEEAAELQLHGSPATVAAVLRELSGQHGLRPAEAGEFTRRALESGRLDLAEVEGLADLLEAETEAQRKQALRVFSGALGRKVEGWRARLIRAAALVEATIDFADEDLPVDVAPEVVGLIDAVGTELEHEARGIGAAERIRDGFEVAIVGHPNTGKSTLLNHLAGREAAITSEHAGTTRDVIEVRMDLGGLPVTLLDTAGLRAAEDAVEAIGVQRARERAAAADLRVFLVDERGAPEGLEPVPGDIVRTAKGDLAGGQASISGLTGKGVKALISDVSDALQRRAGGAATMTRERHRLAVLRAQEALEMARLEVKGGAERAEFAAEELRRACRALDSLVGRVDVEDLLDEIFASFCIGK